jgi:D-galactarolactone isomerase
MRKPEHEVPAGTIDCHMHIYDPAHPLAPTALAAPPPGALGDYLKLRERLGIARTVVVQPTAYGADNTVTLNAIATMGTTARGIAMVTGEETDGELERLAAGGMRGFKFRALPGGVLPQDRLERMAARAQELDWIADIEMDGRALPDNEAQIARLPGRLIIDHIGKFLEPVALDHPGVGVLMRLVASGQTYVKIASPYDSSRLGGPKYADLAPLVALVVREAPDRLIWASNWPHAALTVAQRPDDAAWLDLMSEWMDETTRRKMLVDTPAELFGF